MIKGDLHVHTNYCDGKSSAEETVLKAIKLGLSVIGFSGHGYTSFDTRYCMTRTESYRAEISALSGKYKERIKILCGVERDLFGEECPWADFTIGSVHYMKVEDELVDVDESPEKLLVAAKKYFDGDVLSLCEIYFDEVGSVAEKLHPDIIGHFDLISKFNEDGALFDEDSPRYINAWKKAVDKLLAADIPFEINTGAICRGYRSVPYPSGDQVKYIASKGGRFILTSDCHFADNLCFEFPKWEKWAKELGARITDIF